MGLKSYAETITRWSIVRLIDRAQLQEHGLAVAHLELRLAGNSRVSPAARRLLL